MTSLPQIDEAPPTIPVRQGSGWMPILVWAHVVLVLVAVATVYYRANKTRQVKQTALAVYSKVGDFSLHDSAGDPFGLTDLEGYSWVASFSQGDEDKASRLINLRMEEMQDVIANARLAKLVTFSLAPEHAVTEQLAAFAKKHRKTGQWVFVSGSREELAQVMSAGFRLPRAQGGDEPGRPLPASNRLILVDGGGNIRGYYDTGKIEEVRQLAQDIGQTFE